MLQKLSIVTGVVVLFGIALWFIQGNLSFTDEKPAQVTILSNLDTEQLSGILIQNGGEKVELVKETDQAWKVKAPHYQADLQKIQGLLLQLLDTKLGEQVTDNTKHHARFHLMHSQENEEQWEEGKTGKLLLLQGKDGTPVLELLLGKSRSEKQGLKTGHYIRFAEQPAVYLIAENIQADTDRMAWLNTTIVDLDGDELIKSMELQNGEEVFRFVREKKEEAWQAEGLGEEAIDQNAIKSLSNALSGLEFDVLVPVDTAIAETGREELVYYTAEAFDGRVVRVSIGNKEVEEEENRYYLAIEMTLRDEVTDETLQAQVQAFNQRSQPWLYGLPSWIGKRFLKGRSDWLVEAEEENDSSQ